MVPAAAPVATALEEPLASQLPIIDFSLLAPLRPQGDVVLAASPVPWQHLLRVTPGGATSLVQAVELGDFFHKVLERMCWTLARPALGDLQRLAFTMPGTLSSPERHAALVTECNRLLDIFYGSPLYTLMQHARQRMHELPYTILGEAQSVRNRRLDLLIEDAAGQWHVIDYKTDHVAPADVEKHALEDHGDQLKQYQKDLHALTAVQAEAHVYFAQLGLLHRLDLTHLDESDDD